MRPIDADALKHKRVIATYGDLEHGLEEREVVYVEDIDNAPTIEAKPVVHAHWEDNKCSNCKEEAFSRSWDEPIYDYDWDENLQYSYTEHHTEYELTAFCPYCGAQMDENHIADAGKKE